ncbi:unnamed protein product [Boreogadus saida]
MELSEPMYSCKQCTDTHTNSWTTPKNHTRSRSYTRSLTSAQLGDSLNRQFETVCETMFGEVESQAMEALDLPGVFRTRSHSYVRAIQAGCSQDDDCLSVFSVSGPQGSMKAGAVFPYRKGAPPPLPPRMSKSSLSVRAQSSTESTQDAYFLNQQGPPSHGPGPGPGRLRQHSNSVDLGGSEGPHGRSSSSRAGYYTGTGPAVRPRQHSNSAESLDGGGGGGGVKGGSRELVPYGARMGTGGGGGGGGGGMMMMGSGLRAKHSSSADSLLEGPPRPARERDGRAGGSLGKSASLPQNSMVLSKTPGGQEDGRGGRKWRPSIAVQVDSSETLSDSDLEGKALREVHSIGVQVEDDKRRARFKRSNSVTASVQADLDPEGFPPGLGLAAPMQDKGLQFGCSFQRHSSEPESASQYAEFHRTVHTQGQWAYREDYIQGGYAPESCQTDARPHPILPSRAHSPLPLTSERAWAGTPSLEGPRSLPDSGRASPCMRDGEFFLRLLQTEVERIEGWCQGMEREAEENELPEEALELIRNAIGSAQMLMSQKVQQFFRLCQQSVDPSAYPQPTSQDLASFWDLLQLNIEDVRVKFQDLQRIKDSGWLPAEKKEDKKLPPPLPKKSAGGVSGSLRADSVGDGGGVGGGGGGGGGGVGGGGGGGGLGGTLAVPRLGGRTLPVREKSLDLGDRQRTEARRRLLQTKRTASFRQNSATESADSIEIYIPEAQTRL